MPSPHESTGSFPVGQTFASCRLIDRIGAGAMGAVYRAVDGSGRQVALKVIRDDVLDADALARFRREGEALGRLPPHRNVLQVHSAGVERGRPWLVLELIEGETLKESLARGPLPVERAVEIGAALARAVAHAHAHGVLHRDLKPANVVVRAEDGSPVVMDFGLARLNDGDRLTRTGDAVGTPMFMSPEQALPGTGPIDERTDVHALGAILYELLTGRQAFLATNMVDVIGKIVDDRRPSARALRPEVDEALDSIVAAAFARDHGRRLASAALLAERLERWLELRRKPAPAARTSRRGPLVALAIVAVGVTAALALEAWPHAEDRASPTRASEPPIAAADTPRPAPPPTRAPSRSRADLLTAIERGDLGSVARLIHESPIKAPAVEIDDALARGLARQRERGMAVSFLQGLPELPLGRESAFERGVIAFVLEDTAKAFAKGDFEHAVRVTIACGKLGFPIPDPAAATRLAEDLHNQSIRPSAETWGEVCAALVSMDVDLDYDYLTVPLTPPRTNDEASRYLAVLWQIELQEHTTVSDLSLEKLSSFLGEHCTLGPRTQARIVSLIGLHDARLGRPERVALVSHACGCLDPSSPVRMHELSNELFHRWREGECSIERAIAASREVRERWIKIGSPMTLDHDVELAERDLRVLEAAR
jgi:serine/threonine-protein kinase